MEIARDGGVLGFFRGWLPAYMRAAELKVYLTLSSQVGPLFLLMPALVEQVRRRVFGLDYIV